MKQNERVAQENRAHTHSPPCAMQTAAAIDAAAAATLPLLLLPLCTHYYCMRSLLPLLLLPAAAAALALSIYKGEKYPVASHILNDRNFLANFSLWRFACTELARARHTRWRHHRSQNFCTNSHKKSRHFHNFGHGFSTKNKNFLQTPQK